MLKQLKKNSAGFTIIEVLIVLAIAGLIMLIVFLAVPALQRNSRNTAIRNDASSSLSGANEFVTNNNGSLPTTATVSGTDVTFSGASGTTSNVSRVRSGTSVAVQSPAVNVVGTAASTTGSVQVITNNGFNGNTLVYKARAIAASFLVETSGSGTAVQCLES
ncbi:hypothetical protein A3D14_02960 [Candidatus Saccharibacteria bacterium RIFCSPHIGHO2_02_FULL_47_12]|nr:MAG: hypothetical protein A3D14_02960 [Candidatus Saccharibacteria bacterium RIFCSPHIGHO2_02_FULL_47_12]